jgi:predicted ArsR family transcriptional regulator
MRRYSPTTVELIAKSLFLTTGTVKRHLRTLVDERVVFEHECCHSTFREGKGLCYRMMHIPRKRT